ncbi:MAG: amino acid ABC transporter substrate-binding protein [Anaerofustis stercorihominis]|nr:amino acid ABC transporter substrate-binding protein [Anaerofustis stercorihominis]
MKKVIALLTAFMMLFSLVACGGNDDDGADNSWKNIEEAGKIVLGLDPSFPPMGYLDTQTGEYVGYDIDVAKAVAEKLDVELVLQPIDWGMKLNEINNGNIDVIWNGFSWTEQRAAEHSLSFPYMKNNQVILVKTDSQYNTLEDLVGAIMGVQEDSSALHALENDANKAFADTLKETVIIGDYAKAVLELQNDTINAIAIDEVVARFYLDSNPGAYRILETADGVVSLAVEDYVIGFRLGDEAFVEKVEEALIELSADGTLAKISQEWFSADVNTVPTTK